MPASLTELSAMAAARIPGQSISSRFKVRKHNRNRRVLQTRHVTIQNPWGVRLRFMEGHTILESGVPKWAGKATWAAFIWFLVSLQALTGLTIVDRATIIATLI